MKSWYHYHVQLCNSPNIPEELKINIEVGVWAVSKYEADMKLEEALEYSCQYKGKFSNDGDALLAGVKVFIKEF